LLLTNDQFYFHYLY